MRVTFPCPVSRGPGGPGIRVHRHHRLVASSRRRRLLPVSSATTAAGNGPGRLALGTICRPATMRSRFDYVSEEKQPPEVPNWKHRADYIRTRSTRKESTGETNIEPEWADEAFTDLAAVVFSPDPAAKKGLSDRTIGWSASAGFVITVITVHEGGKLWGANAWKSNDTDQRHYQRATTAMQDTGEQQEENDHE